ncbi:VacJ family lipoprotein [Desulfococcaceae bacterium HSG8]|nr:VacJ family lipoprotein [Desulfococcaceae bacterium HSG8]
MRAEQRNYPLTHSFLLFVILAFCLTGCAHGPLTTDTAPALSLSTGQSYLADASASDRISSPSAKTEKAGDSSDDDLDDFGDDDLDLWDEGSEEETVQVADPLAPFNRVMFHFNDKLYYWVLKPVATGYKSVTPAPVRIGVKNFFHNLSTPIRFANCIFQGKFRTAEVEFARFLINSTAGVLGFGDVAKNNPSFAKPQGEDMGQTLATYGIGNGFYIVWPIMGPSTLRDSVGIFGDRFLSPVTWTDMPTEAAFGLTTFKTVNESSFRLGDYEGIREAAIEPYEAFRDAYLQYRKKKTEGSEGGKGERRYDNLIKEWIK